MWKNEEITGVEFARLLNVSRPTLYRYVREFEEEMTDGSSGNN